MLKKTGSPFVHVFLLTEQNSRIVYSGCHEIRPVEANLPDHIKGALQFAGEWIPALDLAGRFNSFFARSGDDLCVLVLQHRYEEQKLHTAALLGAIEDILKYAASQEQFAGSDSPSSALSEVLEVIESIHQSELTSRRLAQNHIMLREIETIC